MATAMLPLPCCWHFPPWLKPWRIKNQPPSLCRWCLSCCIHNWWVGLHKHGSSSPAVTCAAACVYLRTRSSSQPSSTATYATSVRFSPDMATQSPFTTLHSIVCWCANLQSTFIHILLSFAFTDHGALHLFSAGFATGLAQDTLALVLSVTVLDVLAALAPELRICLLQMLPSVVLQTGQSR